MPGELNVDSVAGKHPFTGRGLFFLSVLHSIIFFVAFFISFIFSFIQLFNV